MHNHAPKNYECPFCGIVRGVDGLTTPDHIVFADGEVTAFVAANWWPNNPGHVLVVPNDHYENIYDLPDELGTPVHAAARRIAIAMKRAFECEGVSTRQHNEPSGNQDVWHYHLHVIPRHPGDRLYGLTESSKAALISEEMRSRYSETLRRAIEVF